MSVRKRPEDIRRVGLLQGGNSAEREVSLRSAEGMRAALESLGYEVQPVDPSLDGWEALLGEVDLAINALHGGYGEDGRLQGYCALRGIPLAGTAVLGSAVGMAKDVARNQAMALGIPVANAVLVDTRLHGDMPRQSPFGYPVVVKAVSQGSSVGVYIVQGHDEFREALEQCGQYDRRILIEACVRGYEVTCGFLGQRALPPVGIVPRHGFYDYRNKYTPGATRYDVPAHLEADVLEQMRAHSESLASALGLCGCYRVDFIVREGTGYFLEINTSPGMTPTSLIPQAAQLAGLSYADILHELVLDALDAFPG